MSGVVARIAVAVTLPTIAFWMAVSTSVPKLLSLRAGVAVFRVLDLPTSALNALLPYAWRSYVANQFSDVPLLFGWQMFARYIAIGTAAYRVLIYGIEAIYRGIARIRRRRAVAVP